VTSEIVRPAPRVARRASPLLLASLVALLVLPFWVFAADAGDWESRLASFKTLAAAVTVLYFVAGTLWMNENEKRRTHGGR